MTHHSDPRHHHPHHPHRPLHRAHNRNVEALRAMMRAQLIADPPALIAAANDIDRTGKAGAFLAELDPATPAALAIRQLEAHLETEAMTSYARALGYVASARVVVIVPVPPYFFEDFASGAEAVAVIVDHHELPPSVRHAGRLTILREFHHAQAAIEAADIVLFDAYDDGGALTMRSIVAALLDERHLPGAAKLLAHARHHLDPTDVPAPPAIANRIIFI